MCGFFVFLFVFVFDCAAQQRVNSMLCASDSSMNANDVKAKIVMQSVVTFSALDIFDCHTATPTLDQLKVGFSIFGF